METGSDDELDGFPGITEGWLAIEGMEDPNVDTEGEQQGLESDDVDRLPGLDSDSEYDGFGSADEFVRESDSAEEVVDKRPFQKNPEEQTLDAKLQGAVSDLVDRSFRAAQMALRPKPITMPWETGVAAGVFRQEVLGDLQKRLYRPEYRYPINVTPVAGDPKVVERLLAQKQSVFPMATRRIRDMLATDATDLLRSRALGRWKQLLQLCPEGSDLGRLLLREVQHLKDDACLLRILNDTVAKKSAGTLLKRSGEILKFVSFCAKIGVEPFPFDELVCYQYLCHMSDAKQSKPTNASSFRSAVAFCLHVFGFDGALTVLESKRSQGIAHSMKSRKAPLKQKRTFKVAEIVALEKFAFDPESPLSDAIFVGHVLFCIYSRSRWGDHQSIERLHWDLDETGGGFVQGDTRNAKTSVTAEQKTRFLPLTAPLIRLSKYEWWEAWRCNREKSNLCVSAKTPFLPAPASDSTWCLRPVTAGEAGAWIREILRR